MGMSASVKSPWSMTVPRERIDWNDIKDRIDLAAIATALFGPAPKRSGRRLLGPARSIRIAIHLCRLTRRERAGNAGPATWEATPLRW